MFPFTLWNVRVDNGVENGIKVTIIEFGCGWHFTIGFLIYLHFFT